MNGHARWSRYKDSQQTSKRGTNSPVEKKKGTRRPLPRPHETEEEAIIRRFHDAQRMARFRAKRKKAMEEAKALEASKLTEIAMISELRRRNVVFQITTATATPPHQQNQDKSKPNEEKQDNTIATVSNVDGGGQSKYSQLLTIIEELGRDIRLTYAGSRSSAERLKTGIVRARMLVRDCLLETELNSRQ